MAGYVVEKLILFGSRARNEATEDSDRNYPWVREIGLSGGYAVQYEKRRKENPCRLNYFQSVFYLECEDIAVIHAGVLELIAS